MSKTVYSLVLSGNVVQAVDALARQQGLSRSALVDRILAEYARVAPPQAHTRAILKTLGRQAGSHGFAHQAASGQSLALRTSLNYKYNPAMHFTVELEPAGEHLGRLKVSLRSRNQALLADIEVFFKLWQALEQAHLPQPPLPAPAAGREHRYVRFLRYPRRADAHKTGRLLANYLAALNACLNTYIGLCANKPAARRAAEDTFRQALEAGDIGQI